MAFSLSGWFKGKPNDHEDDSASNGAQGDEAVAAQGTTAHSAATPASVRTVMPKSAQPVNLREPGARQPVALTSIAPPVATNRVPSIRASGRKVTFPIPAVSKAMSASPQPSAHAPTPRAIPLPPTPAAVLEGPDVAVTLEVGDFVDRLPSSFLSPGPHDRRQTIEFRASELYSDLTKGRASVPASTIYAKYPAIFVRPVTDTEDVEVALPLQKLVEQLGAAFQTRSDQVAEDNVGEIETPFLQVAKEDGERLPTANGTVAGAIRPTIPLAATPAAVVPPTAETVSGLPVRPAHRTGQISTISAPKVPLDLPTPAPTTGGPATGPINPGKRPPSTVRASVAGGKIRLSGPSAVTRMSPAPVHPIAPGAAANPPPTSAPPAVSTASQRIQLPIPGAASAGSPSLAVSKKTARIQIPPISLRAGGPSTGPRPVALPAPASVPVQPSPVSIRPPVGTDLPRTFRSSPPPPTAKLPPLSFAPTPRPNLPATASPAVPATPEVVAVPSLPAPLKPASDDDRKIELGLASVLRGIPSEALTVEPWTIADDVRFSLPFAGVEKQLSLGRVSISLEAFLQALPEAQRHVIAPDSGLTEIHLPLPEIFQNLPASALAIRADQVTEEAGTLYPTPFSQKADEDAQRFNVPPVEAPAAEMKPSAIAEQPSTDFAAVPVEGGMQQASFIDQPATVADALPPAAETDTLVEPVRDVPLDLDPSDADEQGRSAPSESTEEAPAAKAPALAVDLPAEPVVELPADAEPAPVEEALAVLESTAPAQAPEAVVSLIAPASVEAPAPVSSKSADPAPVGGVHKGSDDSALQTLFMTEEEIDAKAVVRLVSQLPGVSGCTVMFADGLRLAGNFPDGDVEGFSAMAPPFYKRAQNFVSELDLGPLKTFTVYTEKDLLSFFMHDDLCVSVRHTGRGFLPGVREKLEVITRELSGMYSTAKPIPVDFSL